VLVVLVGAAIAVVYEKSNHRFAMRFDVPAAPVAVPAGAAAVAEGKRIYTSRGCADCHGADLAGQAFVDDPMVGRFAGANLTKGKGGVGGERSEAELARAIRHGVGQDGRALIFMPATDFFAMSDADVGAVIAYIRNAPPVDKPAPEERPGPIARVLNLTGKMPYLVSALAIDHQARPAASVKSEVSVAFGRYLANGCTGCHGPGFSGGPIPGGAPDWPPAKNLTQDVSGLAKWSEGDFIKAVQLGIEPNGEKVRLPMPWQNFSRLTETEVKALWMYLKSAPPKPYGNR
jgi:mono/diheme cytochrome c family protein